MMSEEDTGAGPVDQNGPRVKDPRAGGTAATGIQPRGDDGISGDIKWMMRTIAVAVIVISIGIAALVSVAAIQFGRGAVDMRHHEHRLNASNSDVILAMQRLFDRRRGDDRERMAVVEDVLGELRETKQRLDARGEPIPDDIRQALSSVERTLNVLIHFRPVRTRYVAQRLDEVREELGAIRQRLEQLDAVLEELGAIRQRLEQLEGEEELD